MEVKLRTHQLRGFAYRKLDIGTNLHLRN